jgi:hypothetical protein
MIDSCGNKLFLRELIKVKLSFNLYLCVKAVFVRKKIISTFIQIPFFMIYEQFKFKYLLNEKISFNEIQNFTL